jgi:hypothetical protein
MKMLSLCTALTIAGCGGFHELPGMQGSTHADIGDATTIQLRADGSYDVTCKDGSREVRTALQLQAGDVCETAPRTVRRTDQLLFNAGIDYTIGEDFILEGYASLSLRLFQRSRALQVTLQDGNGQDLSPFSVIPSDEDPVYGPTPLDNGLCPSGFGSRILPAEAYPGRFLQ